MENAHGGTSNSIIPNIFAGSTSEAFLIHDHEDGEYQYPESQEEVPSFEELRHDMVSRLDAPSFRNRIRSQIRASLALHLAPSSVLTAKGANVLPDPVRELANAIVAQHLVSSSCDFSLSVFLPESQLNREVHPMNLSNLLMYLRVQYPELEELAASSNRSLLSLLVTHLPVASEDISSRFSGALKSQNILKYNSGSQTESARENHEGMLDLQAKLYDLKLKTYRNHAREADSLTQDRQKLLDEMDKEDVYLWNRIRIVLDMDEIKSQLKASSTDALETPAQIAAAFRKFRKDVEAETAALISKEKGEEFALQMRTEKDRLAKEVAELSRLYEKQLQDMRLSGSDGISRMAEAEQKLIQERDDLQRQVGTLAAREKAFADDVVRRNTQLEEKDKELISQAKKLADLTEVLQARENSIQNTINSRVGELISIQTRHLEDRENKLKREEQVLNKLKDQLTKTIVADSTDTAFLTSSSMEPKPFLQKIKSEFSRLHRENQKLKDKLSQSEENENAARDKQDLDRKVRNLKAELASAREEISRSKQEHSEMVRELAERSTKPEHDLDMMKKDNEVLREKLLLESVRWETDRDRLKTMVKEKGRKVELLKQQVREKDDRLETLTAKLNRLQGISSQASWLISQHSSSGNAATYSSNHIRAERPAPEPHSSSDESGLSLKSIIDAKERIRALEREATTMQQQFSSYRRLVTDQFKSTSTIPNGEPTKKLLLTQYLIQEKPRPSTLGEEPAFGSPVTGLSRGDVGKKISLQLELQEAQRLDLSQP